MFPLLLIASAGKSVALLKLGRSRAQKVGHKTFAHGSDLNRYVLVDIASLQILDWTLWTGPVVLGFILKLICTVKT